MTTATACPRDDELQRFVEGAISVTTLASMEDHVADCARCARVISHAVAAQADSDPAPHVPRVPRARRDSLAGRVIAGFVVRELIAEGGFGAVYRCEQPLLGREVVLKVVQARLRGSDVIEQRFLREAKLASRLDHPYAAHIYAFGVEKEDNLLWLAMEMVQGTPLDRWLRTRGPLTLDQFVPFFERLTEVVETLHDRGIVHRDLKPANVMLIERSGRLYPKLLDLGIARSIREAVGENLRTAAPGRQGAPERDPGLEHTLLPEGAGARPEDGLTQHGAAIGSPPYMAPEQWLDASRVGPRADLYALAVLAYEAITGRRPFTATTVESWAQQHLTAAPPPVEAPLPPALDGFFRTALAKRPNDRPASALQLAAQLRVAAGIGEAPVDLPRLDPNLRAAWLEDAPQVLAECVAALDGARNLHQARDAAWELVRTLVQYLLVLAIAARATVRDGDDDPRLLELLRALHRRDLDLEERVRLLALLCAPFAARGDAHPLRALVDVAAVDADGRGGFDRVLDARTASGQTTLPETIHTSVVALVAELNRLLRRLSFVLDHTLIVPRGGAAERWTGLRRGRRPIAVVRDHAAEDRAPFLIDASGRAVLMLWPLVQVAAPMEGADDELFLFEGRGRHGARMTAMPAGFEHHDPSLWDWLGANVLGGSSESVAVATSERPPYLALEAFAGPDVERFFGREHEVDAFRNRLSTQPLQIVVGPSGAGKSSFIAAGVLPTLPSTWRIVTMRPGGTPLDALGHRLAAAGLGEDLRGLVAADPAIVTAILTRAARDGVIVLVVDQLEEIFTLCQDAAQRDRFAALMASLSSSSEHPLRVIATVRDDFLMRVEGLESLRSRLAPSMFLIGNPSRADMVRVLVEPARRAGYEFSDAQLPEQMVDAIHERAGALALLSFTAAHLWDVRDRRFKQLTRRAYDAMGGVGGALGHHAEQTFATLGNEEQALVRQAFRHLVTGDGTRAVLTGSELAQLLANPRAEATIERLVKARLLVVRDGEGGGDSEIEIAHEALLAAWPRLALWTREDVDGARLRDQLRAGARQWIDRGKPSGLLWRAEVLAELERWRSTGRELTDAEALFANASRLAATRGRRLRRVAIGTAFAILSIAVLVLVRLSGEVRAQRDRAQDGFGAARRAVDTYLTQVSEEQLLDAPGMQPLREKLLAAAMGYYTTFAREHGDDPAVGIDLADAERRAGSIAAQLGHAEDAMRWLADARRLYLAGDDPTRTSRGIADTELALANVGTFAQREVAATAAIAAYEPLQRAHPDDVGIARGLGRSHDLRGAALIRLQKRREGTDELAIAVTILRGASARFPNDSEAAQLLASAFINHAEFAESATAIADVEGAVAIEKALLRKAPTLPSRRRNLVKALGVLGKLELDRGRVTRSAETEAEAALECRGLMRDNPGVVEYQRLGGLAIGRHAEALWHAGRPADAIALAVEALDLDTQRLGASPTDAANADSMAWWAYVAAIAELATHRLDRARTHVDRALELYAPAVRAQPDDLSLASDRAWAVETLLEIRARAGELSAAEALRAQGDAVAVRQAILDRAPANPQFRAELAAALVHQAVRGIAVGESGTALGLADRAVGFARTLSAAAPDDLTMRKLLADALGARAEALDVARDPAAADTAREALVIARSAAAVDASYDVDVACAAARSATFEPARRAELAEQALAALERLASTGASDVTALDQGCFAHLRGQPRWSAAQAAIAHAARPTPDEVIGSR